jgi:hypothetical protein
VNDSPGFDAKSVVYSYSQTLNAGNIAFCGLHRDMPEEKLDLLKLASRIMAETRQRLLISVVGNSIWPCSRLCGQVTLPRKPTAIQFRRIYFTVSDTDSHPVSLG